MTDYSEEYGIRADDFLEDETEDFLFHGSGYYDEVGIWHDPEVEENQE